MAKKFYKSYENYAGYVYILSNPCFPYLKIGCTTRSVDIRLHEINKGTGTPAHYKEEYSIYTRRVEHLELKVHEALHEKRVKDAREMFDVSLDEARETLNRLFREVEDEIDNDPKLKRIFGCIAYLTKELKNTDYHEENVRFKKIKKDLSYLRHSAYSIEAKYEKILNIEKQIKSLKGY